MGSPQFGIFPSTSSWLLGPNPTTPTPYPEGELGDHAEGVHHLARCLHTHTHKGGKELRACNSQPSESSIYWGLKVIEAHLMTLVYAKNTP